MGFGDTSWYFHRFPNSSDCWVSIFGSGTGASFFCQTRVWRSSGIRSRGFPSQGCREFFCAIQKGHGSTRRPWWCSRWRPHAPKTGTESGDLESWNLLGYWVSKLGEFTNCNNWIERNFPTKAKQGLKHPELFVPVDRAKPKLGLSLSLSCIGFYCRFLPSASTNFNQSWDPKSTCFSPEIVPTRFWPLGKINTLW